MGILWVWYGYLMVRPGRETDTHPMHIRCSPDASNKSFAIKNINKFIFSVEILVYSKYLL